MYDEDDDDDMGQCTRCCRCVLVALSLAFALIVVPISCVVLVTHTRVRRWEVGTANVPADGFIDIRDERTHSTAVVEAIAHIDALSPVDTFHVRVYYPPPPAVLNVKKRRQAEQWVHRLNTTADFAVLVDTVSHGAREPYVAVTENIDPAWATVGVVVSALLALTTAAVALRRSVIARRKAVAQRLALSGLDDYPSMADAMAVELEADTAAPPPYVPTAVRDASLPEPTIAAPPKSVARHQD